MSDQSIRAVLGAVQDFEISVSRAVECLEAIEAGTFTDDWLPPRADLFGLDDIPVEEITRLRSETQGHEDYRADVQRLCRKIDVALNGEEGAAPQASLCDLVGQIAEMAACRSAIRDAVRGYYAAIDQRQHGGIARAAAFRRIERALGMQWAEGASIKDAKGFTLVELMIVVAIVGILAAVAVPAYREHQCKEDPKCAMTIPRPVPTELLKRSGFEVVTDPETGCEYLVSTWRKSAAVPRLDAQGKPICGGR